MKLFERPPLRTLLLPLIVLCFGLVQLVIDIPERHRAYVGGISTGLVIGMIVGLFGEIWCPTRREENRQ